MPDLSKWERVAIQIGQNFGVGPKGDKGNTGNTGSQGPIGPQGQPGVPGATGLGLVFKGTLSSSSQLPTSGNTHGDYYLVSASNICYIWSVSVSAAIWVNAGALAGVAGPAGPQGPQGVQGLPAQTVSRNDIVTALGYTPANPANMTLSSLVDVHFTDLLTGDMPAYDIATSKWLNTHKSSITDGGNF